MKYFLVVATVLLLSGCATSMTDQQYISLSTSNGFIESCYQAGNLQPVLYVRAKNALGKILNTKSYSPERFNSLTSYAISIAKNDKQSCRHAEVSAYRLISMAQDLEKRRAQMQADLSEMNQTLRTFNHSMNSTLQNDQPNTQQGTWGMQPQPNKVQNCYRFGNLVHCR